MGLFLDSPIFPIYTGASTMPRQVFGLWATQTVATNNITSHGHAEIWKFLLEYQLDIPLIQWAV